MTRSSCLACVFILALSLVGCRHDWHEAQEFAERVGCGMSESHILKLAKQYGAPDDLVIQRPSPLVLRIRPKELDFVDVLMEGGSAEAVQRGNYVAFTTGMEFGQIQMLCGAPQIKESTLAEYERNLAKSNESKAAVETPSN